MWTILGCATLIALISLAIVHESRQWDAFAALHHCKIVGEMSGDVAVGPVVGGKGGMVITATPDKTGYMCDDGITYWR